jgi:hypothetical protein
MAGNLDNYTQLGMGSMNTKRQKHAQAATKRITPVEGNGAANRRRQSTADAALGPRRGSNDRSRKSPPPSYGRGNYYSPAADETRNGQKSGFQWRGNSEEERNKKSSGGVIAEEENYTNKSAGRTSDWLDAEPRVHDADLERTIAACEQPFSADDVSSFGIQRARKSIPVCCTSFLIYNRFIISHYFVLDCNVLS